MGHGGMGFFGKECTRVFRPKKHLSVNRPHAPMAPCDPRCRYHCRHAIRGRRAQCPRKCGSAMLELRSRVVATVLAIVSSSSRSRGSRLIVAGRDQQRDTQAAPTWARCCSDPVRIVSAALDAGAARVDGNRVVRRRAACVRMRVQSCDRGGDLVSRRRSARPSVPVLAVALVRGEPCARSDGRSPCARGASARRLRS